MSRCTNAHRELNDEGVGKCSVPMWQCGCPAGFCNEDAYGTPDPTRKYVYDGYVPGLACPGHGGPLKKEQQK